jgi:hypothetical protein
VVVVVTGSGGALLVLFMWLVCVDNPARFSDVVTHTELGVVVAVVAVLDQVTALVVGEVFLVFLVKMELVVISELLAVLLAFHDTREDWRGGVLEAQMREAATAGPRLVTNWYSWSGTPG